MTLDLCKASYNSAVLLRIHEHASMKMCYFPPSTQSYKRNEVFVSGEYHVTKIDVLHLYVACRHLHDLICIRIISFRVHVCLTNIAQMFIPLVNRILLFFKDLLLLKVIYFYYASTLQIKNQLYYTL